MRTVREHGLTLAAIENFDPAHWHDILLDGPDKHKQIGLIQNTIRAVGKAGIPVIGYNFSIAGVWGWTRGPYARGGAMSVAFDASQIDPQQPIPDGMVWNMRYRATRSDGVVAAIDRIQLSRCGQILQLQGWLVDPGSLPAGLLCLAAGALHLVRMIAWKGWLTTRLPLLWCPPKWCPPCRSSPVLVSVTWQ